MDPFGKGFWPVSQPAGAATRAGIGRVAIRRVRAQYSHCTRLAEARCCPEEQKAPSSRTLHPKTERTRRGAVTGRGSPSRMRRRERWGGDGISTAVTSPSWGLMGAPIKTAPCLSCRTSKGERLLEATTCVHNCKQSSRTGVSWRDSYLQAGPKVTDCVCVDSSRGIRCNAVKMQLFPGKRHPSHAVGATKVARTVRRGGQYDFLFFFWLKNHCERLAGPGFRHLSSGANQD